MKSMRLGTNIGILFLFSLICYTQYFVKNVDNYLKMSKISV